MIGSRSVVLGVPGSGVWLHCPQFFREPDGGKGQWVVSAGADLDVLVGAQLRMGQQRVMSGVTGFASAGVALWCCWW